MKLIRLISAVIFAIFIAGCTEKETQVEVSSVSLNTATIEMVEGETFSLVATVLPKDAEYDGVTWASSNASVASVNSGTVTAIKEGTATITASAGGKSATCTVKVSTKVVAVTSITLDKISLSMKVGETETITATVNPANATDKSVTWGSSDVSVATVSDGKVTAKKSGTATITAKAGSCIAECTVSVSVDVESVTLDKTSLELVVGETAQLTATVKPDDATDKNVSWSSSDESVAKVDNGRVTAVKAGKATITAKCGGKTAECTVTVTVPTGSVTLDKTSLTLAVGETAQLTATVKPDNATDKTVTWTSSDESVAKVDNGRVTAVKSGNASITAKCGDKTAECAVTVTVPTNSVTLDKTSLSLAVGETAQLTATVKPDNATDKSVIWTSSDESVAKVDNGRVTAVKAGNATITAKCGDKTAECAVTVTVPTGSVTLDKTSLSLAVGEAVQLTATVKPDNATDKTVTWTSSDESVAKVDNGKVTAVKSGNASITAKCGGKTAECVVTVTVPAGSVTLDKTTLSLAVGETCQLTATVKPDNATDKTVIWTSSDEAVAKVDNGRVTVVKAGKATITAKCGGKTAECVVTVTVPVGSVTLDKTSLSLAVGETAQLMATVKPDDASDKIVIWNSSNESVVSVSNGEIYCVSVGTAIISATCGGKYAQCTVSVSMPNNVIYYTSSDQNIINPYNTDAFGSNIIANKYERGLGRIIFDGPVTKIGKAALYMCSTLLTIQIPSTITIIDNNSFKGCEQLQLLAIPDGVTSIGNSAFEECKLLNKIIIPDTVKSIGEKAFYCCVNLTYIELPNSVQSIGKLCFFLCTKLKNVNIPSQLTKLEDSIFQCCFNLELNEIPINIKSIGNRAFNQCRCIKSIKFHEGLETIGFHAFSETSISDLKIPDSVISIGTSAFKDCKLLKNVLWGNGFVSIPGECFSGTAFSCISIPENVTHIGDKAFSKCDNLSIVYLPSTIGQMCGAFDSSTNLKTVYLKATTPPEITDIFGSINTNTFYISVKEDLCIYVPMLSIDAYKSKWSCYKDYIQGYDFE